MFFKTNPFFNAKRCFLFYITLQVQNVTCRDGRVVKARHQKCLGVSPRRFESCSRRIFYVFLNLTNENKWVLRKLIDGFFTIKQCIAKLDISKIFIINFNQGATASQNMHTDAAAHFFAYALMILTAASSFYFINFQLAVP